MAQVNSENSTSSPSPDDRIGIAWWNSLPEKDRRHWLRVAQSARPIDAWIAFKGARLSERELDPRDVIAEILEEHLVMDPRAVADAIVEHLRDAGFVIRPTDEGGAHL